MATRLSTVCVGVCVDFSTLYVIEPVDDVSFSVSFSIHLPKIAHSLKLTQLKRLDLTWQG